MVCIEGLMDVSGTQLGQRDALEVQAPSAEEFPFSLSARGTEGAHFMMVEMAREEDDHIQPNARKDSAEGPMAESHRRFKELRL